MTPEQLAHELDVANDHGYCRDAAIMIRQQQAEIEALKMEIHSLTYGERLAEYLKKAQEK